MMVVDGTEVLTLGQIASMLGTTVEGLRNRMKRGTLSLEPCSTLGRTNLYDAKDIRLAIRTGRIS